jgi:hypothetical protein
MGSLYGKDRNHGDRRGLDRRVATLRAFELYFPGDYRECMRISAQYPDGETAIYEYLKGLLIKPKDARESPLLNEYSPGRETPYGSPQRTLL